MDTLFTLLGFLSDGKFPFILVIDLAATMSTTGSTPVVKYGKHAGAMERMLEPLELDSSAEGYDDSGPSYSSEASRHYADPAPREPQHDSNTLIGS
jgi:hypothetical protein